MGFLISVRINYRICRNKYQSVVHVFITVKGLVAQMATRYTAIVEAHSEVAMLINRRD
ncbi:hypothetical protein NB814_05885 [Latilactobacillus curvatus]|nr:hypothetical protein [Latilactobacillus curvatus]